MKATGEVMAIGTNLESALLKAIRSLEENIDSLILPKLQNMSDRELRKRLENKDSERMWVIAESLRRGISIEEIYKITLIDEFFLSKFYNIIRMEDKLIQREITPDLLMKAKQLGFTDNLISRLTDESEANIKKMRMSNNMVF